jgi:hypothetical protein
LEPRVHQLHGLFHLLCSHHLPAWSAKSNWQNSQGLRSSNYNFLISNVVKVLGNTHYFKKLLKKEIKSWIVQLKIPFEAF